MRSHAHRSSNQIMTTDIIDPVKRSCWSWWNPLYLWLIAALVLPPSHLNNRCHRPDNEHPGKGIQQKPPPCWRVYCGLAIDSRLAGSGSSEAVGRATRVETCLPRRLAAYRKRTLPSVPSPCFFFLRWAVCRSLARAS